MNFKWNEKKFYTFRNRYNMEVSSLSTAKDIINNTTGYDDIGVDGLKLVEVMRSVISELMEQAENKGGNFPDPILDGPCFDPNEGNGW